MNWTSLDDLYEGLTSNHATLNDALPTFGGAEPSDTNGVWSWDPTRLLVGDCLDNLEIIDREEWVS